MEQNITENMDQEPTIKQKLIENTEAGSDKTLTQTGKSLNKNTTGKNDTKTVTILHSTT